MKTRNAHATASAAGAISKEGGDAHAPMPGHEYHEVFEIESEHDEDVEAEEDAPEDAADNDQAHDDDVDQVYRATRDTATDRARTTDVPPSGSPSSHGGAAGGTTGVPHNPTTDRARTTNVPPPSSPSSHGRAAGGTTEVPHNPAADHARTTDVPPPVVPSSHGSTEQSAPSVPPKVAGGTTALPQRTQVDSLPGRAPRAGPQPVLDVPEPEGAWSTASAANRPRATNQQPATAKTRLPAVRFVEPSTEHLELLIRNKNAGTFTPVAQMDAMVNTMRAPAQSWMYMYTDEDTRFVSEEKAMATAMNATYPTRAHEEAIATLVCCRRDSASGCFVWGFHSASASVTLANTPLALPVRLAGGSLQPKTFYFEQKRASSGFWLDIPEFPFHADDARDRFHKAIAVVAPSWIFGAYHQCKPTAASAGAVTSRYRLLFLEQDTPVGLANEKGRLYDGVKYQGRLLRWYPKTSNAHFQRLAWLDLDDAAAESLDSAMPGGPSQSKRRRTNQAPAAAPQPWHIVPLSKRHHGDQASPPRPFATETIYAALRTHVKISFNHKAVWKDQQPVNYNEMLIELNDPAPEAERPNAAEHVDRVIVHQGKSKRVYQTFDELLAEFAVLEAEHQAVTAAQAAEAKLVVSDPPSFHLQEMITEGEIDGINAALAKCPADFGFQLRDLATREDPSDLEDLVRQRVLHRMLRARYGGWAPFHELFATSYGTYPTPEALRTAFDGMDHTKSLVYPALPVAGDSSLWARDHECAAALVELLLAALYPTLYASDVAMGLISECPIARFPVFLGAPGLAASSITAVYSSLDEVVRHGLDDILADVTANSTFLRESVYATTQTWTDHLATLTHPVTGRQLMAGDTRGTSTLRALDGSPVGTPRC